MLIEAGQVWVKHDRARIVVAVLKDSSRDNVFRLRIQWKLRGSKTEFREPMRQFLEWTKGARLENRCEAITAPLTCS